jgi:hypothetical protein
MQWRSLRCVMMNTMQPEAKVVKRIQHTLAERGARAFKIHGDDNFQEIGIPDLLCTYLGRSVGLEVKLRGNSPSPVQKVVLHEIVAAGGYAVVVSTVEEVEHLLAHIDLEVGRESRRSAGYRRDLLDRSIKRYS